MARAGKHLSSDIRAAFVRACRMVDDDMGFIGKDDVGGGLSTLIKESLQEDVRGTLQAMKGFVPKELDIDAAVGAKELTSEEWLERLGHDSKSK